MADYDNLGGTVVGDTSMTQDDGGTNEELETGGDYTSLPSDSVDGQGAGDGQGGEPQTSPYTDEELTNDIKAGKLDEKRLTSGQKAVLEHQRRLYDQGHTKTHQENAELRRRLEAIEAQQRTPADPLEQVRREYMQSPAKVNADIDRRIEVLEMIPATDERFAAAQQQARYLSKLKESLRDERQQSIENRQRTAEISAHVARVKADVQAQIVKDIPDWNERSPKLAEFAVQDLGIPADMVNQLSNPMTVIMTPQGPKTLGEAAVKFTKALNSAFTVMKAGQLAEAKKTQPQPQPLARGGTGDTGGPSGRRDPFDPKLSSEERIELFRKMKS